MLDDIFATIAAEGYHIEFLHQVFDGSWQVSLRQTNDDTIATYPASAPTCVECLTVALSRAKTNTGRVIASRYHVFTGSLDGQPATSESVIDQILTKLTTKRPVVTRRI